MLLRFYGILWEYFPPIYVISRIINKIWAINNFFFILADSILVFIAVIKEFFYFLLDVLSTRVQ